MYVDPVLTEKVCESLRKYMVCVMISRSSAGEQSQVKSCICSGEVPESTKQLLESD